MIATRASATGVPGYSETLPCEAESASEARRLVRAALNTWDLSSLTDNGVLVVSELVTNSVQHSRCSTLRVSVERRSENRVRVAVSDRSRRMPVPDAPEAKATSGRGLVIVEALADDWNVDRRRWGKVVWAELVNEVST
ncbi:ATP-binding protein [Streptomyces sp. C36]|uniref:ATP-binding protein n=1 Tax=Streptomyces sp. C36 TaxID=3237122 RepID=UPI0034C6850E